ncbi:TRAP transporter large permease [Aquimarina sp. U1-2]|uniref:TRAP transporter large permease n=1 Tax=Aquimarina sp. U1-2 TaxID=2823141 RepID=UPI001AEC7D76|nr:TRAP transporter large permease [Aquimarina sp. U1-2]MBP2832908.1 TRAP transporter large permease [Aquimarina sp. U1-2]
MTTLTLLLSFLILLFIRVPVGYSIGLSTFFTLLFSLPPLPSVITIAQRMATSMDSFALLAIPLFILAGQIMNQGGIAKRLVELAKGIVGPLPGGLAFVNIVSCMLFGAISGSAAAAASAIGGFMTPVMVKEGYDKSFSTAVNITSSTTGLIIPPSNILILYSLASGGISISALFLAGYIPGILVGLSLMIVAGTYCYLKKYPTIPFIGFRKLFKSLIDALPSLFLLVVVMGGIITGIFTATEASAVAVLYALVLAIFYKEISFTILFEVLLSTVKVTAIVLFLIMTSMAMSWVMSFENIPQEISTTLLNLSDNPIIILLLINLILLFVGVFMDMTPAVLIFTPIFLPITTDLGIDPIHFGIIMIVNLCIGLCTPPVGSILFIGCSVSNLSIQQVSRPLIPLFFTMILALWILTMFPEITLWLPRMFELL